MSGKDQRAPGTCGGSNYLDYTTEGLTEPGASAAKLSYSESTPTTRFVYQSFAWR